MVLSRVITQDQFWRIRLPTRLNQLMQIAWLHTEEKLGSQLGQLRDLIQLMSWEESTVAAGWAASSRSSEGS